MQAKETTPPPGKYERMHSQPPPLGGTNKSPKFDARASTGQRAGALAAVVQNCLKQGFAQKLDGVPKAADPLPSNFGESRPFATASRSMTS